MAYTNVELLLVVNFLHVISYAIIVPILPYYFRTRDATYSMIGILCACVFIGRSVNKELLALLPNGKKYTIATCLYLTFVYYFIMVFYDDLVTSFIVKFLFALTIDIVYTSKEFVTRSEPEDHHYQICNLLELTKYCALIVGAVLGSYIYSHSSNSSTNFIISSCLALVCILILQRVDSDDSAMEKRPSELFSLSELCKRRLRQLKRVEIVDKWYLFMSKSIYIFLCNIYFARICYILIDQYNVSYMQLGYAAAIENMVICACSIIVPFITERYDDKRELLLHSMFVSGILLAGFYSAPSYGCSIVAFMCLTFFCTMINGMLHDDVLNFRYEDELEEVSETVTVLINLFAPIFAGIINDLLGENILDLVAAITLCGYMYVIIRSLFELETANETEEENN